ncbi:hypothetical protein MTR_0123s0030 [Medicago truncatula]|uniref:Uncharacterized protein n=1 Tax=Medicago truncatula TaxID=3880 RepID=A0A072TSX2_MEDTR|nr:hypothetical protein MTR_0123s0030 [Medicago truncatula]
MHVVPIRASSPQLIEHKRVHKASSPQLIEHKKAHKVSGPQLIEHKRAPRASSPQLNMNDYTFQSIKPSTLMIMHGLSNQQL